MTQLSFATWNVFNHAPTFARRLPAIIATLKQRPVDILALQELPCEGAFEYAIARELGLETIASVAFLRPDDAWSERLAVLSSFPASEFEPIDLRLGVPNALRVRLTTPGGRLDVYNLHLHPRDQDLRLREMRRVIAERTRRAAVPAIVAGDFNAAPSNAIFDSAEAMRSAYTIRHDRNPDRTFATPLRDDLDPLPAAALDHVLVEPRWFAVTEAELIGEPIAGEWPSDHWGLRVVLDPEPS